MLPTALTAPPTLMEPVVITLPPATLPAALTSAPEFTLPPVTLPPVLICPEVLLILPPTTLPATERLVSVPTAVKLEFKTLALMVLPVSKAAAAVEITPVNCEPLPTKN